MLAYPNFDVDFVLETDASHQGMGTVITEVGKWQAPPYCNQLCSVRGREELWDRLGSGMDYFSFPLLPA